MLATTLAERATALRTKDIPPAARSVATCCVTDIIGVAVAGSTRPIAKTAAGFAARTYGAGQATLIATGALAHPRAAALANGVAGHALDYDDTSYAGILHATAVVFPAVLAAAETHARSGAEFLRAFVAGVETTYTLGKLLGTSVYDRGWFTTGVLGSIGAAAATSVALAGDTAQTRRAIALCAAQAGGARAILGTDAKSWAVGRAALAGYESALAATEDIGVPDDIFEGRNGLFQLLTGRRRVPGELDDDMGLLSPGVFFKRYPVCSSAQAALTALEQLMTQTPFDNADVERIDVELAPLAFGCLPYTQPKDRVEAQFSAQFALACLLVYGKLDVATLDAYTPSEARLLEAMAKIATHGGLADLDTDRYPEAARVTVSLKGGSRVTRTAKAANGHPESPLSAAQLDEKFRTNLAGYAPEDVETQLDAIRGLQDLGNVCELLAPLRACA